MALALVLGFSVIAVRGALGQRRPDASRWHFFLLGVGFMLLETKAIMQFALLWGSTWVVASLAIASVLVMAMAATWPVSRVEVRRPWAVGARAAGAARRELSAADRAARARQPRRGVVVYALLMFSPICCAGLLFGAA